jgi:hypothetical protein
MHLPFLEVECPNKADGFDIVEIGVFKEELLKTIETAINEAIDKKANMNDILVVINEIDTFLITKFFDSFDPVNDLNEEEEEDWLSLTSINNCIKNEDFDLKTGMLSDDKVQSVFYGLMKKCLREMLKHPNICIDTLKEVFKCKRWLTQFMPNQLKSKYPKCIIIGFQKETVEQLNNDLRNLYSSEFKHVIYIVTGDGYSHNYMSSLSGDISEFFRSFLFHIKSNNEFKNYLSEGHENL